MEAMRNIPFLVVASFLLFTGCSSKRYAYDVELVLNCKEIEEEDIVDLVEKIGVVQSELTSDSTFYFPFNLKVLSNQDEEVFNTMLPEYHEGTGVSVINESIEAEIEDKISSIGINAFSELDFTADSSISIKELLDNLLSSRKSKQGSKHLLAYDPFSETGYEVSGSEADTIIVYSELDSLQHAFSKLVRLLTNNEFVDESSLRPTIKVLVLRNESELSVDSNPDSAFKQGQLLEGDGGATGYVVEVVGESMTSTGHAVDMVIITPIPKQFYLVTGFYSETGNAKYNATLALDQLINQQFVNARILKVGNTYRTVLASSDNLDKMRQKSILYRKKFQTGLTLIEVVDGIAKER